MDSNLLKHSCLKVIEGSYHGADIRGLISGNRFYRLKTKYKKNLIRRISHKEILTFLLIGSIKTFWRDGEENNI